MNKVTRFFLIACAFLSLNGCGKKQHTEMRTLKVAATANPHAKMLEHIRPDLKDENIELKIMIIDDYNLPNRALSEKEIDANFFQHIPFMEEQIATFHYPITCYAKIHLEPMGIYSKKIKSIREIKDKDTLAIPNDPTNEYRALILLQQQGLITLKNTQKKLATVADIARNPKQLKIKEVDAAYLTRSLPDVAAAVINANYALQANLIPTKDALALESNQSQYVNILTIRIDDAQDPRLEALKKWMLSEKMRTFILDNYKGEIIPVLQECK